LAAGLGQSKTDAAAEPITFPPNAPGRARGTLLDLSPFQTALALFLVSILGAVLPLYRRWSDRGLHIFVALAAGIFLGTIFLHLLPEMAGVDHGHAHDHGAGAATGGLAPWIAALAGLLLLFAIERVWIPSWKLGADGNPHVGLWAATFVGLSLHALSAGIGLSAILEDPAARTPLLVSILLHKGTETFSLATVMRLANLGRGRMLGLLLLFALIEPAGLLAGSSLFAFGHGAGPLLTGFACGTFLYVAVCDLLPEVFHGVDRPWLKLAAVVAGVALTAVSLPGGEQAFEFAAAVGRASLDLFVEFAPFLILGFLIAGVLSQLLSLERLTKHVRGDDFKSVAIASLVGAPLPLCSCSVVPVAVEMRRSGASKGATSAFLISTPETGVDSLTVTWALLDPLMTIARPIGAVLSALFTGSAVNLLVRRGFDREPAPAAAPAQQPAHDCCAHTEPAAAPAPDAHAETAHAGHAGHAGHAHAAPVARRAPWLQRVLRHAFVDLLDDLTVSLLLGTLLSGLISVLVPAEVFEHPAVRGFPGMLLMLAIGIPIYVCAAASTTIAATLILKGMSPGAAFVFLLASPATNLGSLFVLRRHLGTRVVLVHVTALAVVTLLLGLTIDALYGWFGLVPTATAGVVHQHAPFLAQAAAVVLGLAMLISLLRTAGARAPQRLTTLFAPQVPRTPTHP